MVPTGSKNINLNSDLINSNTFNICYWTEEWFLLVVKRSTPTQNL